VYILSFCVWKKTIRGCYYYIKGKSDLKFLSTFEFSTKCNKGHAWGDGFLLHLTLFFSSQVLLDDDFLFLRGFAIQKQNETARQWNRIRVSLVLSIFEWVNLCKWNFFLQPDKMTDLNFHLIWFDFDVVVVTIWQVSLI